MQWNVFLYIFNSKYRFFICVINSVLLFRFKNRLLQQMNGLMWIQKIDTKPHATGKPQMTSDQQINIILHMYAVAVLKLLFFFDNTRYTEKKFLSIQFLCDFSDRCTPNSLVKCERVLNEIHYID